MSKDKIEEPLTLGGTNFRDYKLVLDEHIARFKPTWRARAILFFFGFIGLIFFFFIAFMAVITTPNSSDLLGQGAVIYGLMLLGFLLLIRWVYKNGTKIKTFDLIQGIYYQGDKADDQAVRLASIQSLQLIRKTVYSNSSSFNSFELNLVARDGKRFKVVDHAEGATLKAEAQQLAELLKVEIKMINTSA